MNRDSFWVALAVVFVCGWSAASSATNQASPSQPLSKATASVELVPGESRVIVRVRNISDVAVEAWRYKVTYDLGSGPMSMDVTLDAGLDPNNPGSGAIQPRTVRSRVVALPGIPVEASATLVMLILADGTFEGPTEHRNAVLHDRERRGATLSLWIEALQGVSGKQGREARSEIETLRQFDKRYTPDRTDSWALATDQNIKELISNGDVDQLPARLSALLEKYRLQRERALRHTRR